MMGSGRRRTETRLRPSGYASRLYEISYGHDTPLYDLIVRWGFLPFGGERACRARFARWCAVRPGQRIASLCCGTGSTDRAILREVQDVRIVGVDLGAGQIARARRLDRSCRIDYRLGNAARTGLEDAGFDRVLIVLALHEMPRDLRHDVLREARRLCRPDGRVVAIEHGSPDGILSRAVRSLLWFLWLPGNPERPTSLDLQRRGLSREMTEAGLEVIERHATSPDWIECVIARRGRGDEARGRGPGAPVP